MPRDYDEERRLLYVAITRAETHVIFTAGEDPNIFIEALPVDVETVTPDVTASTQEETEQIALRVEMPVPEAPRGHTPHTLMRDDAFEDVEGGRGTEFGTQVHDFAEAHALGESIEPRNTDEERVKRFLNGLDGELLVEEDAYLPPSVAGERVTISGVVDLVHVTPNRVEIVDYKTDRGRHGEPEYGRQLSVYYHVARDLYPHREITASIFYTEEATTETIDPLSFDDIRQLVADADNQSLSGSNPINNG